MKIPFNKKWVIIEKEDYANYLFVVPAWEGFTAKNPEFGFINCRWLSAEYIDKACNLFLPQDAYQEISKNFLESIFSKPKIWDRLHKENVYYAKELIVLANKIKRLNPGRLSNREMVNFIELFKIAQQENHDRRGPMFMVEARDNFFSNYLIEYLKERCQDLNSNISAQESFQVLSTPRQKSALKRQKEGLIKVALVKDKIKQSRLLRAHAKKYEWLEYGLQGKILSLDYFKEELAQIRRRGTVKLFGEIRKEQKNLVKRQKDIENKLKIHRQHRYLFKIVRDSIYSKAVSKDAQFYSYYASENFFKEVGRRGGLSLEQVRFLTLEETEEAVLGRQDFSKLANARMKYSLHFSDRGKTLFFDGDAAKKIRKKIKFVIDKKMVPGSAEELKGNSAFQGKAIGKVKIINTPQEMIKMHQGNILVSHMTNPDIVPVMKMAAAIVTDLGGITCHAAIVSRELRIPCVIGTKFATKVLKDGDKVEVDADKGIVKILK